MSDINEELERLVAEEDQWTEHVRVHPSGRGLAPNGPWKPLETGLEEPILGEPQGLASVPGVEPPKPTSPEVMDRLLSSTAPKLTEAQQTRLGSFKSALRAGESSLAHFRESTDWMAVVDQEDFTAVERTLQAYVAKVRSRYNAEQDKRR